MSMTFEVSSELDVEVPGTRPFGLDALVRPDGRAPALGGVVTVDPVTQLSMVDGRVCLELPEVWQVTALTDTSASPRDGMEDEDEDTGRC
ncbi:hypothetical protein [Streptomyces sp. NPDC127098]|uniref:hypothetical protein n=1 Tax=Streptomyces sp. NPDC127098 TaxID=3347137 RepID=UPI003656CC04